MQVKTRSASVLFRVKRLWQLGQESNGPPFHRGLGVSAGFHADYTHSLTGMLPESICIGRGVWHRHTGNMLKSLLLW